METSQSHSSMLKFHREFLALDDVLCISFWVHHVLFHIVSDWTKDSCKELIMLGLPVLHPLVPATFNPRSWMAWTAVKQEPLYGSKDSSSNPASVAVGFAFVDAAAGKFYVGTIQDDCSRSALRALLTQVHSLFHCCCIQIMLVMWEVH